MECFPDFCLGCDSQATDGLYCSEACRMLDLSRSGSGPSSPVNDMSSHGSPYNQFIFPSAFDQPPSRYPPPPTKSSSSASLQSRSHAYSYSAGSKPAQHNRHRVLSPSSSRSSLISNGQQETVSEEAAKELLSYFNAFDRTRDQRRKSLPATKQSGWTSEQ